MNTAAVHSTPAMRDVVREQVSAIGGANRREIILGGILLAAVVLVSYVEGIRVGEHLPLILIDLTEIGLLTGLFAPLGIWRGEGPSRRAYFWSLPVARQRHSLAKVFSGWLWTMAIVAALLLLWLAVALVSGGPILIADEFTTAPLNGRLWPWLVPFTGATVAYLMGSVVALLTDHPWWVYAGAWFFFMVLAGILGLIGKETQPLYNAVIYGDYGLATMISGCVREVIPGTGINGVREVWQNVPDARAWIIATVIWTAPGLLGVFLAARRRT